MSEKNDDQTMSETNEDQTMSETNEDQTVSETKLKTEEHENDADEIKNLSNDDSPDMSMFASVWVKVEVMEQEQELENPLPDEETTRTSKRKSRRPQKILKTLQCAECDYTTIYKNCLQLHVLGHTNFKPFSCDSCDYVTKYPTSLQRHVLTKHTEGTKKEKELTIYNCEQCPYTTYYKCNLNSHKRKHKLEKEFKCSHCPYTTSYRHNYLKHSKVHNKTESHGYKCDKCPFVTKFEGHITRHLAKIHNEVSDKANRCDLCDFSTKVRWRLNIHKQRSKQTDIIKCNYCEFKTFYRCESKKHIVTHYSEIYVPKNTQNQGNFINYQETSSDLTLSDLQSEAGENASQAVNRRNNQYKIDPISEVDWNNIQVSESSDKEKPFKCTKCQYIARFKASVQRHFQRHHTGSQNRPYKCVNCDFSTKTKDQISLHNKRSQSEIEIFCTQCDFSTHFKCQYVMHQKCHYEHKCTVCSYTCKNKYEITKHYSMVHLGNGLKCRFCDYKAFRVESLQCHETIHTGHKPFKCSYCNYMSVRKSLLVNHVKRYHSDVKIEPVVISDSKIESLKMSSDELANQLADQNGVWADYFESQASISMDSKESI